ncbi:hypothetical protein HMPREF0645_1102 [Hallella bergensis DSM 17361]|uniref:Uncharacterized protein n=2 Tax=Hallella bergensis TaxID=242750 RepID=D1PVW7_9BACT|nr:hypothetical protein HMPREF0645_1102 [Hallella bergensis DSM 17361]
MYSTITVITKNKRAMKDKLYYFLIGLCLLFAACSDKDDLPTGTLPPVINFPMESLSIDLNKIDNLPVIAIVRSEVGLSEISVKIKTAEGIEDYKTITDFFDDNAYSLAVTPEYRADFESIIVKATDRKNQVTEDTLKLSVIDVFSRPEITFTPAAIVYDEMDENPQIPRTTYVVKSDAGIKHVEMYLVSADGQTSKGVAELDGEKEYTFDEMIEYKEGDKGFKVKVTDIYGNITVSTLPVTYKTLPIPSLTLPTRAINTTSDIQTGVPMKISSVRGVRSIKVYEQTADGENLLFEENKANDHELDIAPKMKISDAAYMLKVVVSDGRAGKEAVGYVKVYVDMNVGSLMVGSQPLANAAHSKYPEAFGMVSIRDMKTYSVDYAIGSEANAKNIDFKFYCFGGKAIPRLYSMDNTEKDKEFNGATGKLSAIPVKNGTRFAKMNDFDYEKATKASISKILSSNITISKLTPFEEGDIIAFRTGKNSTAGGAKIGVMKVVKMVSSQELGLANKTAVVLIVEIKFPKY